MAPKKKQAGKDEEEDLTTKELLNLYKKFCKELEVMPCKPLEININDKLSEDLHLNEILISEKVGELGMRALSTALIKTK